MSTNAGKMFSAAEAHGRSLRDIPLRETVRAQFSLAERRQRLRNGETTGWRRARDYLALFALSGVGLYLAGQSVRFTGATNQVADELLGVDPVPLEPIQLQSYEVELPQTQTQAQAIHPHTSRYDFDLPADTSLAPESLPLGPYNGRTGDGTIYNQTIAYSNELGYTLDEREEMIMTGHLLDVNNNMSWPAARHLSARYEPMLPSQDTMIAWLEAAGADKTHAADRPELPPIAVEPPPEVVPPPVNEPAPPLVIDTPDKWPWEDGKIDWRDLWTVAGLAAVLGVAWKGQEALNKGKAEAEERRAARLRAAQAEAVATVAPQAGDDRGSSDGSPSDEVLAQRAAASQEAADELAAEAERRQEEAERKSVLKTLGAAALVAIIARWGTVRKWLSRRIWRKRQLD